jgi:hypothetical protein
MLDTIPQTRHGHHCSLQPIWGCQLTSTAAFQLTNSQHSKREKLQASVQSGDLGSMPDDEQLGMAGGQ